jgi:hypothetical protein
MAGTPLSKSPIKAIAAKTTRNDMGYGSFQLMIDVRRVKPRTTTHNHLTVNQVDPQ